MAVTWRGERGSSGTFLDGDRITAGTDGCKCGPKCPMPCWMRVGLTSQPCCPDCERLADPDTI